MDIYDKYLPQIVSDYSGLHLFLYNISSTLILLSPGACNHSISEVDEYRKFSNSSQYTTKLNDAQVSFGLESIINCNLLSNIDRNSDFIAIIGTPITDIIGTDLPMISKKIESILDRPTVYFNTNGFETYSKAISKAYLKILPFILREDSLIGKKRVNLIGFHPLVHGSDKHLKEILDVIKHNNIEFCLPGVNGIDFASTKLSSTACISIILSEEGALLGEKLKEKYGIPCKEIIPISKYGKEKMVSIIEKFTGEIYNYSKKEKEVTFKAKENINLLIIGEPFFSSFLRESFKEDFGFKNINILSILPEENFSISKVNKKKFSNIIFEFDVDKFIEIIKNADLIIGDPLLKETIPYIKEKNFIALPYFGISGREYSDFNCKYIGENGFNYFKEELAKLKIIKFI